MKNIGIGGWVVLVGLWGVVLTADVRSQEGAVPAEAHLELPNKVVANGPHLCRCEGDLGASVARIRQVLSEPLKATGLEFTDEPLENAVNFLQDEYNIPIQIDEPAIENAGLTRDEPLTVQILNVTLQSALRMLLKQKHLTYVIRDEVLLITTPEEAESELKVCVYDVRDLIGRNRDNKNLNALVDTISGCVARQSWVLNGQGGAEIKALQPGLLVIAQTQAVHDEIGGLLSLIRETVQQPAPESRVPTGREMRAMVMEGMGELEGGRGMEGAPGFGGEFGREGSGRGGYGSEGSGRGGGEMGGQPEPAPADDLFQKP